MPTIWAAVDRARSLEPRGSEERHRRDSSVRSKRTPKTLAAPDIPPGWQIVAVR